MADCYLLEIIFVLHYLILLLSWVLYVLLVPIEIVRYPQSFSQLYISCSTQWWLDLREINKHDHYLHLL